MVELIKEIHSFQMRLLQKNFQKVLCLLVFIPLVDSYFNSKKSKTALQEAGTILVFTLIEHFSLIFFLPSQEAEPSGIIKHPPEISSANRVVMTIYLLWDCQRGTT